MGVAATLPELSEWTLHTSGFLLVNFECMTLVYFH